MSDFDFDMEDMQQSAKKTKSILTKTLANVKFAISNSDEEVTNDIYVNLIEMLRRLRVENNMCIETLVEEAMQDE